MGKSVPPSPVDRKPTRSDGAPPRTGTLISTATGHFAQFSVGGGRRKGALLTACGMDKEAAVRRQLAIAKLVDRLRESGHLAAVEHAIQQGAIVDGEGFRKLSRFVERVASGKEPGLAEPTQRYPGDDRRPPPDPQP